MKKIIPIIISILITGCSPSYYVPNSQNIPIMKSKGQANFGIGIKQSEYTASYEFQGAYAITNHVAMQLNADLIYSADIESKGNMLEIGAGYYKKIAPDFVFETYGLLYFGNLKIKDISTQNNYNDFSADIIRLGIQPSLSYNRKYFTASISTRLANLNYYNINGNYYNDEYDINYLKRNNSYRLIEPALTLQTGFKDIKLQLQYVYSYNLTDPSFEQELNIISLGLKFNIDPKKK